MAVQMAAQQTVSAASTTQDERNAMPPDCPMLTPISGAPAGPAETTRHDSTCQSCQLCMPMAAWATNTPLPPLPPVATSLPRHLAHYANAELARAVKPPIS